MTNSINERVAVLEDLCRRLEAGNRRMKYIATGAVCLAVAGGMFGASSLADKVEMASATDAKHPLHVRLVTARGDDFGNDQDSPIYVGTGRNRPVEISASGMGLDIRGDRLR